MRKTSGASGSKSPKVARFAVNTEDGLSEADPAEPTELSTVVAEEYEADVPFSNEEDDLDNATGELSGLQQIGDVGNLADFDNEDATDEQIEDVNSIGNPNLAGPSNQAPATPLADMRQVKQGGKKISNSEKLRQLSREPRDDDIEWDEVRQDTNEGEESMTQPALGSTQKTSFGSNLSKIISPDSNNALKACDTSVNNKRGSAPTSKSSKTENKMPASSLDGQDDELNSGHGMSKLTLKLSLSFVPFTLYFVVSHGVIHSKQGSREATNIYEANLSRRRRALRNGRRPKPKPSS